MRTIERDNRRPRSDHVEAARRRRERKPRIIVPVPDRRPLMCPEFRMRPTSAPSRVKYLLFFYQLRRPNRPISKTAIISVSAWKYVSLSPPSARSLLERSDSSRSETRTTTSSRILFGRRRDEGEDADVEVAASADSVEETLNKQIHRPRLHRPH